MQPAWTEGAAMKIIKADVLGMCFGVRDALAVIEGVDRPHEVTIHGELVHNEEVLDRLAARCFHMVSESRRTALPLTETVLITAHGVSQAERQRLQQAGKALVDTTCPLVTRAHQAAQKLQAEGCHVLVLGKRGHVEVQGIVGDLASYDVVQGPEEVRTYPFAAARPDVPDDDAGAPGRGGARCCCGQEPARRAALYRHDLPADEGASTRPRGPAEAG